MHGGAAQRSTLAVEQVAVGRLAPEQPGDLVDEPLENGLELELAGDDLCRAQERRLLQQTLPVLFEQPCRVDRERELARDRLDQGDLAVRPRARGGSVKTQNADRPVEGDHRRRNQRLRSEPAQRLCRSERRILELGSVVDVRDDDRPPLQPREIRGGEILGLRPNRLQAGGEPLRGEPLRLPRLAEADEAAGGVERPPDLRDRDSRPVGEPFNRSHPARDVADEPLARERLVELAGRSRPLERERGLGGQRLHQRHLLARERALRRRRRGDEHADDPLRDDQRHEGAALGADRFDETRTHERRDRAVEDDHRRGLEVRARDSGRLVAKIDPDVTPPGDVGAGVSRQQAPRLFGFVVDQRQRSELDSEHGSDFVEQDPARGLRISRPGQRVRDCGDRLELSPTDRDKLLGLTCSRSAREQLAALTPASEEDERREERDQGRRESQPEVAAERVPVVEDGGTEDRRRDPETREHQP